MSFSNYLEDILLNCVSGKIWYSPQELWVGFSSSNPTDTGAGIVEPPSMRGYQRRKIIPTDWLLAADGVIANDSPLAFATASQDWPFVLTHFVIWDATWMIIYGELTTPKTVLAGQTLRFNPTKLELFLS